MVLNLINRLNRRTKSIIGIILYILIITAIISLVMCIVFGAIGTLAKLSFMTSLAGFCFLIFLIAAGVLITIFIIPAVCLIIDAIRRDGLKKLLKRHIKIFIPLFIILVFIHFIKYKNLEWVESFLYSLLITLTLFLKTEVGMLSKEIEQEHSLSVSPDESDNK